MRDSQGPPCQTVDFATEMHSYDAALKWLLHSELVDPGHVYLLGHSIGGLIVPQLAVHNRIAGVIVADTVGINWFEYELMNERRQLALAGESAPEIDDDLKLKEVCTHWLEIDRRSYESILRQQPDCKQFLDVYPVSATYMQQVAALNIAAFWHRVRGPVLVIYGLSDFITDEDDHKRIVSVVNQTQPGNASLVTIPEMDHYLVVSPSQQASYDRASKNALGTYNRKFSESIIGWLCGRESCVQPPGS
jgi:pimeloyl-ACP methyl ester carboxylesterase